MLTFRAINDYKGIRKGQVWDLSSVGEVDVPINQFVGIGTYKSNRYVMVREIDKIISAISLTRTELEQNFEWVNGENEVAE